MTPLAAFQQGPIPFTSYNCFWKECVPSTHQLIQRERIRKSLKQEQIPIQVHCSFLFERQMDLYTLPLFIQYVTLLSAPTCYIRLTLQNISIIKADLTHYSGVVQFCWFFSSQDVVHGGCYVRTFFSFCAYLCSISHPSITLYKITGAL